MIVGAATIHIGVTASDWGAVLPELILTAGVLVMLLLDVVPFPAAAASGTGGLFARPGMSKTHVLTYIALLTVVLSLAASWNLFYHGSALAMYGTITSD